MAGNTIKMKDLPVAESSRVTDLIGLDKNGQSVKLPNEQNEIKTEVANIGSKVGELPQNTVLKDSEYVAGIADDKGNVAFGIDSTGNIITKGFSSAEAPKMQKVENSSFTFAVADGNGNIAIAVDADGNVITKNFNSASIARVEEIGGKNVLIL